METCQTLHSPVFYCTLNVDPVVTQKDTVVWHTMYGIACSADAYMSLPDMSKQRNSGIMVWSIFFRSLVCNIWVQRLWTCVVLFEIFLIRKTIAHRCVSSFKGFPTTARTFSLHSNLKQMNLASYLVSYLYHWDKNVTFEKATLHSDLALIFIPVDYCLWCWGEGENIFNCLAFKQLLQKSNKQRVGKYKKHDFKILKILRSIPLTYSEMHWHASLVKSLGMDSLNRSAA